MVARLTEMRGLNVFTEGGEYIGILEDISIDPETGKVLGVILIKLDEKFVKRVGAEGSRGVIIPYNVVKSVGDIVLLKNAAYAPKVEA